MATDPMKTPCPCPCLECKIKNGAKVSSQTGCTRKCGKACEIETSDLVHLLVNGFIRQFGRRQCIRILRKRYNKGIIKTFFLSFFLVINSNF